MGAAKLMKEIQKDEQMQGHLASEKITWRLNLSRAPWWGGKFERMVGLFKVFLEAKVTLSDCRHFFSANRQCQQKLTCKVSGQYNQNLPRYRRANFRF